MQFLKTIPEISPVEMSIKTKWMAKPLNMTGGIDAYAKIVDPAIGRY